MTDAGLPAGDDAIVPGAALEDPQLRAALERAAAEGTSGGGLGGLLGGLLGGQDRAADDLPLVRHLLAVHPWQEYRYRFGRWVRVERGVGYGISWSRWTRTYDTFQLLDPSGGRPVAEFAVRGRATLAPPAGVLRFAGDPAVAGAYLPEGADPASVRLALTDSLPRREALAEAARLRPGYRSVLPRGAPVGATDATRPWIADHPDKPEG